MRILIADEHLLIRQGFRAILRDEADLRVIAEATNGAEVLSLVKVSVYKKQSRWSVL